MNATAHPFTPEEIMAFLDGELSADRSQSISAHTESCPSCREVVTALRSTSQSLSSWTLPQRAVEAMAVPSIRSEVSSANSKSGRALMLLFGRRRKLLVGAGAFACLLVVLMGLTRGRYKMAEPSLAERISTDRALGRSIIDQQSKVFSNGIPSDSVEKLTTLATPGVAADSNGHFHGLGDHAQNSFSVDGQPIVDQQSRVFSNPMIARTVSLAIVTKDFDGSHKSLDAILTRHNGYAASLSVSTPQGAAKSIEASLRVPAPQLAATLTELRALGRVENEGQNGEEVTQQHADLVARLKNSRETEQRLQDILVHRTGKISDVLSVEQEIAHVRGEIEQLEAEQKNLEHRVDFAAIDLKLSEEYNAQLSSPAPSVSTLLRNAMIDGLRTAADSVLSLVLFFSESGPVVLLWLAILAIPARQLWRRYRRAAAAI